MSGERWLDRAHPPTPEQYLAGLGRQVEPWNTIRAAIRANYGLEGDLVWGGNKYGWLIHYRASGRTLCDLYPEQDSFTALVILGSEERTHAVATFSCFSPAMQKVIDATPAYRDGLWLWVRIPDATAEDVLMLLTIKRHPMKRKEIPRGFP